MGPALQAARFRDERKVGHELTTTSKITCRQELRDLQLGSAELLLSGFQQHGSTVQVALAFAISPDIDALQDLQLERRAETFHRLEAILPRRLFKLVQRGDTQLLIDLEHFVGSKARNAKHFE